MQSSAQSKTCLCYTHRAALFELPPPSRRKAKPAALRPHRSDDMYLRLWCVEELHTALLMNREAGKEVVKVHMLASPNYLEYYINQTEARRYTEEELRARSDPNTGPEWLRLLSRGVTQRWDGLSPLTLHTKTRDAT